MEHLSGPAWALTLERTAAGEALRGSLWLYPMVEVVHILGFALLVGAIAAYDLRLMGVRALLPADLLARLLLPVAAAGLLLAVPSGALLFVTEAAPLSANPAFWAKMGLLGLALANVAAFHLGPGRRLADWSLDARPPAAARVAGAASLALWTGVLAGGRLIAYV